MKNWSQPRRRMAYLLVFVSRNINCDANKTHRTREDEKTVDMS